MAAAQEMRVSDAEREAAAAELREHYASGRLNAEDLDERVTAIFAARTRGELSALFSDLPSDGHAWDEPAAAAAPAASWPRWAPPVTSGSHAVGRGCGGAGWQSYGGAGRAWAGRATARLVLTSALMWALAIAGIIGAFGLGVGRPLGIALIIAALALLRRLVRIFTGRGRTGRGGPRRGGGSRRGGGPRRRHHHRY